MSTNFKISQTNVKHVRTALTAAKSTAHAVYIRPELQAELDLLSGVVHSLEQGADSFKAAYAYFRESFAEYDIINHPFAAKALNYMMLAELIQGQPEEVIKTMKGSMALKYKGPETEAMVALALARINKSLAEYDRAMKQYKEVINNDYLIKKCVDSLYSTMVEDNIHGILLPYSVVQLAFVANKIGLPPESVEDRITKMLLDKKITGTLECRNGEMVFLSHDDFEDASDVEKYMAKTFKVFGRVLDKLTEKANGIL